MLEIPIVFAANDIYAPMCGVCIKSLISKLTDDCKVTVYILTEYISAAHIKKLSSLQTENVSIEIVDVGSFMEDRKIPTVSHLSKETAYRLLIGELFSQYSKVLYIDSDTIVKRNIKELYETDITGYLIGAARSKLFDWLHKYVSEDLHINPDYYFNAGILLVNVQEFTKAEIGRQGMLMLEEKRYDNQDQDVLNILCQNKVKFIDGRWNVEWIHLTENAGKQILDDFHKDMPLYDDDPYIIHYDTPTKPWSNPEMPMADCFWKAARDSVFYEELLFYGLKKASGSARRKEDLFSKYIFPWGMVKASSKILIYGAGVVGKTFLEQINVTKYCIVNALIDKNYKAIKGLNVPVINLSSVSDYEYDYIIVAVEKEEIANAIISDLYGIGISKEKLIWDNYAL